MADISLQDLNYAVADLVLNGNYTWNEAVIFVTGDYDNVTNFTSTVTLPNQQRSDRALRWRDPVTDQAVTFFNLQEFADFISAPEENGVLVGPDGAPVPQDLPNAQVVVADTIVQPAATPTTGEIVPETAGVDPSQALATDANQDTQPNNAVIVDTGDAQFVASDIAPPAATPVDDFPPPIEPDPAPVQAVPANITQPARVPTPAQPVPPVATPAAPAPAPAATPGQIIPVSSGDRGASRSAPRQATLQPVVNGSSSTSARDPRSDPQVQTRINPLFQFASVTYNLKWYILTPETYNKLIIGEFSNKFTPDPQSLLIASGGINSTDRNKYFEKDFFIDNLQLNSIIAMSAANKTTNVTEFSFTVNEPLGLTLLDRLIYASQDDGAGDYSQQPYVLKIEFTGYDDEGVALRLSEIDKWIPFKITEFDFSVGAKGTDYAIGAVVYNGTGLGTIQNTIPFNIELTGGGAVQDLFNAEIMVSSEVKEKGSLDSTFDTTEYKGLADALNTRQQDLLDEDKAEVKDEYAFVFESVIGESDYKIDDVLGLPENVVAMVSGEGQDGFDKIKDDINTNRIGFNPDNKTFVINQGTSITEVINMIVKGSAYIRNQIKEEPTELNKDEPIQWWKIYPTVELLDYDNKRRRYAQRVTWHVKSYFVFGRDIDNVGAQQPKGVHKIYNYLYTGKNLDVLDFDFKFNSAYFQARSVLGATSRLSREASSEPTADPKGSKGTVETTGNSGNTQGDAKIDRTDFISADITQELMDNVVELATMDLEILGDPDYIFQNDIRPSLPPSEIDDRVYTPDGAINSTAREVYAYFSARTPVDYDDASGQMSFMDKSQNRYNSEATLISAIYRVYSVNTVMSGGKFTQTLEMIRQPTQPSSDERAQFLSQYKSVLDKELGRD